MASARTGTIAIFAAKLTFLASGYVGIVWLANILSQAQFGKYSVVLGAVALVNMVLINGTMQTVSRFVAGNPGAENGVRRRAFVYQAAFAGVVVGGVLLGADFFAQMLNDPSLAPLLRLSMAITGVYAFYAINVGYLNGTKQFVRQASLDIVFSLIKWTLMLSFAALGYDVAGVIGGFALAALSVFVLSFFLAGFSFKGPPIDISAGRFIAYAFSVMGVALLLNGLLQTDLFMLKRLSDPAIADAQAGLYGAAQQIARIPYYLMVTASLVLFPTIASLTDVSRRGLAKRADTVSQAYTGILGLVAGMAAVTAPIAPHVLAVLFKAEYAPAGPALGWLIVALVVMTQVNIAVTIISSVGAPWVSAGLLAIALVVQVLAARWLIAAHGLVGAAQATLVAGVVCLVAASIWLKKRLGLKIQPRFVVVVALSCTLVAGLSHLVGGVLVADRSMVMRLLTVAFCGVAYLIYLGLLLLGGALLGAKADEDRVLLVTKPIAPPMNDGSKVFARALLAHLSPDSTTVLSTKAGRAALEEALDDRCPEVAAIYATGGAFSGRLLANLRVFLWLLCVRYHFRTLHFFFAPNKLTNRAVRLLRLLSPKVRFVQTVMSRPRDYGLGKGLVFGHVVTASSEDTAAQLRQASGANVVVVRPGSDGIARGLNQTDARARLGVSTAGTHLLFAGDIDEGEALDHLRGIVPALLRAHPTLHFHFSIRTKHPGTEDKGRAFIAETLADVRDRVSVWVDHAPFSELLDAQDAMLLPQEHLIAKIDAPLVVLESLARGCPVFMLDRPPFDEIVPADLKDRLLGADDEALIDRIQTWLADPASVDPKRLTSFVAQAFSVEKAAQSFQKIYQHD